MQNCIFIILLFSSITLVDSILFSSKPKCPIKKYKSSTYITGDQLLLDENFHDRVKPLENVAKTCKVRLTIRGSYYQLTQADQQVLVNDADLVIGHGFRFELRDEKNGVLCNKICLSKNPADIPEVRCFLEGVINHGLTWSKYNSDVISDGTYAANTGGYQALKTDIQTKCQKEKFKRQLLRILRTMYDEEDK
ncbi:unnamed protein product [Adineta ricciae]|uniref:Uncharacterized protein n=1 Tax=Adineta ricciae TaxID=249248 RepID=A0A814F119_ADIRI|nr:unnamed protein product [Adineta ricciae]CAF1024433.1 unnamed protein product [Adineta ricciae]